tara:strand:+ start:1308 stop:1955 length:648 start_codon:yes stop_codon:yes gene_type:complete
MNYIFGSASGIGNSLYNLYKKNRLNVFGFDINESPETDNIIDLSELKNLDPIIEIINKERVESITYCAGIQDSKNITSLFNVNVVSFIELINKSIENFDETVVCALSSVHSVASNDKNIEYASTKASLESAIKTFSTAQKNSYFYFLRLGATDTNLLRENVKDLDKLVNSLPSGKLFDADDVSKLIFDINTKHKELFNGGHLQIDQGVLSKLSTE